MIQTRSKFIYGFVIDETTKSIAFIEAAAPGVEKIAVLNEGSYGFGQALSELQEKMNSVGVYSYSVTADRITRRVTISSTGLFSLRISTGSSFATSAFGVFGFSGSDTPSAFSVTGGAAGLEYLPQFFLQLFHGAVSAHFDSAFAHIQLRCDVFGCVTLYFYPFKNMALFFRHGVQRVLYILHFAGILGVGYIRP